MSIFNFLWPFSTGAGVAVPEVAAEDIVAFWMEDTGEVNNVGLRCEATNAVRRKRLLFIADPGVSVPAADGTTGLVVLRDILQGCCRRGEAGRATPRYRSPQMDTKREEFSDLINGNDDF